MRRNHWRHFTLRISLSHPRKNRSRSCHSKSASSGRCRWWRQERVKVEEAEEKGSGTVWARDNGAEREKEKESCTLHRVIRRCDVEGKCTERRWDVGIRGEGREGGWQWRRRDGNRRSALNLARCIARRSRASAAASPLCCTTNPPPSLPPHRR